MAPGPGSPELRWSVEEIKTTPSRTGGIPDKEERIERFGACDYARNLIRAIFNNDKQQEDNCNRVQILACYYLQLFFMFRSLRDEDAKIVAVAATFLACKVVDLPRKMRGILRALNQLRVQSGEVELGEDEQKRLSERVLKTEFFLLRIIRYDFDISLPLDALGGLTEALLVQLTFSKVFQSACQATPRQEAEHLRQELLRVAERFMLDSFMGFAPLLAQPRVVAAGALAIATRYIRREMATAEVCRLLNSADNSLAEADVRHVVDEILNVFRTKAMAPSAVGSGAAAAAGPAGAVAGAAGPGAVPAGVSAGTAVGGATGTGSAPAAAVPAPAAACTGAATGPANPVARNGAPLAGPSGGVPAAGAAASIGAPGSGGAPGAPNAPSGGAQAAPRGATAAAA